MSNGFLMVPETHDVAMEYASNLAKTEFCPKEMRGKPAEVFAALSLGAEIGLKPMQAIQNISVINGRPSLWGDSAIAIARNSPQCEYIVEEFDEETKTAICRAKRKGAPEEVRRFSMEDAKQAGLLGKPGPWKQYPKRMLQMRARGFAIRDVFSDALKGMILREEAADIPPEPCMQDVTATAEEIPPSRTAQVEQRATILKLKRELQGILNLDNAGMLEWIGKHFPDYSSASATVEQLTAMIVEAEGQQKAAQDTEDIEDAEIIEEHDHRTATSGD